MFTLKLAPGGCLGLLTFVLPVITFCVSYYVSFKEHTMHYPLFFLSKSIDGEPASSAGSLGLGLSSVAFSSLVLLRALSIECHIADTEAEGGEFGAVFCGRRFFTSVSEVRRVNRHGAYLGLVSALGCMGVGAVQIHIDLTLHLFFAGLFFACGGFFCLVQLILDFAVRRSSTAAQRWVRFGFCCAMVSTGLLVVLAFILWDRGGVGVLNHDGFFTMVCILEILILVE